MAKIKYWMFCAMGASSSLLAVNTEKAAQARGAEVEIILLSSAEATVMGL